MSSVISLQFEASTVEELIKTEDSQRKSMLLKKSGSTNENDEIIGDFVLSLLNHLLTCGCSSNQTASALNFCLDFIQKTCNGNLIDTVRTLHQSLPSFNTLDSNQLTSTLEFLNTTYLTHFSLYKYLLTVPRDQDYTHLQKSVCVPDTVETLSAAKPEAQWRYEEKVASIKKKYGVMEKEITDKEVVEPEKDVLDCKQHVDKETLRQLVEKLIRQECEGIERKLDKVLKLSEVHLTREIALIEAKRELNPAKDSKEPPKRVPSKASASPRGRKSKSPRAKK